MKKIVFTLCCSLFFLVSYGQDVEKDTRLLTETYQLSPLQAQKAQEIQALKYKNLSEIQVLKESNPDIYYTKLRNVHEGANASLQMMLNEAQMKIYNQKQTDLRLLRARRMAELKESGMNFKDIERTMLEEGIY